MVIIDEAKYIILIYRIRCMYRFYIVIIHVAEYIILIYTFCFVLLCVTNLLYYTFYTIYEESIYSQYCGYISTPSWINKVHPNIWKVREHLWILLTQRNVDASRASMYMITHIKEVLKFFFLPKYSVRKGQLI